MLPSSTPTVVGLTPVSRPVSVKELRLLEALV